MITKTIPFKSILTKEEAWTFILENSLATFYLPSIESVSGKITKVNSSRIMMIKWRGRFGALSEKAVEFVPNQKIVCEIQEDSRGVFSAFNVFRWGFELLPEGSSQVSLALLTEYTLPKGLFSFVIERILLKRLERAASKIEGRLHAHQQP
jgi:hypothetical protein